MPTSLKTNNTTLSITDQNSSLNLCRYIPQLVKKLGDSKNIIRQETIRALFSIFEMMRINTEKGCQNFIQLILPYLNGSSNWHIREELLNVLMICFLKSKEEVEWSEEGIKIGEAIVELFGDQKERI